MVDVVYLLPTGKLVVAQATWTGPKVGSHLRAVLQLHSLGLCELLQ